jgi:curved DNA-binding protein CbpA
MGSSVTTRPNHYEVLGLKPTASDKEIAAAFAREIGRPRAFGGLTQLSIAYEVLRDPAKRRAYDDSIGVKPEPLPRAARPSIVQFSGSAHFIGAAIAGPGGLRDHGRPPHLEPQREPEPVAESKVVPMAAASSEPQPTVEPEIASADRILRGFEPDRAFGEENGRLQWKLPAAIFGGVIAAAGLVGSRAGRHRAGRTVATDSEHGISAANMEH